MLYLCMWYIAFKRIISVSLPPLCILSMLYLIMFNVYKTQTFLWCDDYILFVSLCDGVLMLCCWWQLVCLVCSACSSLVVVKKYWMITNTSWPGINSVYCIVRTPRKVILTEIWGCGLQYLGQSKSTKSGYIKNKKSQNWIAQYPR